jgi:hypothetical protein
MQGRWREVEGAASGVWVQERARKRKEAEQARKRAEQQSAATQGQGVAPGSSYDEYEDDDEEFEDEE